MRIKWWLKERERKRDRKRKRRGMKQRRRERKGERKVICHELETRMSFSSVQPLSCVQLFAIPWSAACQASLSITNSQSFLKLMSIESVMPPTISSSAIPFFSRLTINKLIFSSMRVHKCSILPCIISWELPGSFSNNGYMHTHTNMQITQRYIHRDACTYTCMLKHTHTCVRTQMHTSRKQTGRESQGVSQERGRPDPGNQWDVRETAKKPKHNSQLPCVKKAAEKVESFMRKASRGKSRTNFLKLLVWMASLTPWTWVWVNSGSWWWTGRPGVLQFMGSQRVGHDWATQLSWTELSLLLWSIPEFLTQGKTKGCIRAKILP